MEGKHSQLSGSREPYKAVNPLKYYNIAIATAARGRAEYISTVRYTHTPVAGTVVMYVRSEFIL